MNDKLLKKRINIDIISLLEGREIPPGFLKTLTLRKARYLRGLSQVILAKNAKVNQARISMCETGELRLKKEEKERIENVLQFNRKIKWIL